MANRAINIELVGVQILKPDRYLFGAYVLFNSPYGFPIIFQWRETVSGLDLAQIWIRVCHSSWMTDWVARLVLSPRDITTCVLTASSRRIRCSMSVIRLKIWLTDWLTDWLASAFPLPPKKKNPFFSTDLWGSCAISVDCPFRVAPNAFLGIKKHILELSTIPFLSQFQTRAIMMPEIQSSWFETTREFKKIQIIRNLSTRSKLFIENMV